MNDDDRDNDDDDVDDINDAEDGYISQLLQGSVFRGLSRFFANLIIC